MGAASRAVCHAKAKAQSDEGRVRDGITFDTGALIALERRSLRARRILERALERSVRITVPAAMIAGWWRGRSDDREHVLAAV